jgi:hypothetical protein
MEKLATCLFAILLFVSFHSKKLKTSSSATCPVPFNNGDVVSIQSTAFPGVYLRMDSTNCSPTNSCCGLVNTQNGSQDAQGAGSWEKFKLIKQNDGTFCITANSNNNAYLSFDGSGCFQSTTSGCGLVTVTYSTAGSCGGNEAFRIVGTPNGYYGIASNWNPRAFLRIDGTGVTYAMQNGGGLVDGQYYSLGSSPSGYEAFEIIKY